MIAQAEYDHAVALALASPHGEERAAVVREAWEWIGTPWLHRNRIKGGGVDCGNLPGGVFANVGLIEAPAPFVYSHQFYMHSKEELFRDAIEEFCEPLGKVEPLPADIVALQFRSDGPTICHVGIVVAWPMIIHARGGAWSKDGQVELGGMTGPYLKKWSGTWRLRRWSDV